MIKKIFIGVLLAGAFGLLVLGAVNRTLAKTADRDLLNTNQNLLEGAGNGNTAGSRNQDNYGSGEKLSLNLQDGSGRTDIINGSLNKGQNGAGNGGNNNGSSDGVGQGGQSSDAPADGTGIGLAEVEEWLTETGIVESVNTDIWVVTLSDGTSLEIEGRLLSYLIELGFSMKAGDNLVLTGFLEDGDFEVSQIENITTGVTAVVRDENGRPFWAGGRQGGR